MREEDKTYRLIEEYLNKNLRGEELNAFEKELQGNIDLQQTLKLQKLANELVIENRLLQVKDILHEQKPTGGNSTWKFIIGGVAGILLLTGIIVFTSKDKTKEQLQIAAAKSTKPELEVTTERVESKQGLQNKPEVLSKKESFIPAPENTTAIVQEEAIVTPSDSGTTSVSTKTEKKEEKNSEEKTPVNTSPANPCSAVHITAKVSTHAACTGEENGSILITEIKGGNPPYKTHVFERNTALNNTALALSAGTYHVEIKDQKGCLKKFENIIVAKKACPKDYSFNPFIGESWNIPSGSDHGKLFIYNDSGNVYFEKEIASGAEEQWSGESKSGEINTGYFIFVVKYNDGTQTQGSVTIVR